MHLGPSSGPEGVSRDLIGTRTLSRRGLQNLYVWGPPVHARPAPSLHVRETHIDYLDGFTPLRRLNHYLLTYVERDGQFYSYPPHRDDIEIMPDRDKIKEQLANRHDPAGARDFEEYWIYSVGEILI